MRPLRAAPAALLSLFLALGAAAGVVTVPSRPVNSPFSAAAAGYQAGLTALDPSAAAKLLGDSAQLNHLKSAMPGMYASSLLRAHEILAIQAAPVSHREHFLRRELIAIENLPLQQADTDLPAKHRAVYGNKAEAARLAKASVSWDTLPKGVREGLIAEGVEHKAWPSIPISMRAAIVANYWHKRLLEGAGVPPAGTPEYLERVREYSRKGGPYLSDQEATELSDRIFALERIAKRLSQLRVDFAGDAAKLADLDAVAASAADDAPKAKAALDRRFGPPPSKVAHRFVHDPKDAVQREALAKLGKLLQSSFKRLTAGTSAEALLAKAAGSIQVGGVPAGSDGAYQAYGDKLALPADVIDYLLIADDKKFEDLFTDEKLLDGLAVLYLPTYVHETTHRLQGRVALKKSLTALEKGVLYGHEDEHEAYLAQELFVREFAAKKPALAAWARSIPRVEGLWDPKIVHRQMTRVSRLYADVPGGHGRRAYGLLMAISESNQALKLKPRIERELARRRSVTGERHEPVRLTDIQAASISRAADRLLRRWRDIAATDAAWFADMILSYLDEGDARIAALKARLRAVRRWERDKISP